MKKTAPQSGYHQYHHANLHSSTSYRSLVIVFIVSLVASFFLAKLAFRLYTASTNNTLEQQKVRESQSMDELLRRFTN